MAIKNFQLPSEDLPANQPPVVGQRYWVKCEGFRCMATAGYDGKWTVFPSGDKLTSIVLSFWQ
jgi:hypothetical protein